MAHRFDWRTHGRVTMQFCRDCGMPGIVEEPSECPGPPDGAPTDYLAPVQRGTRVVYRNGVGRIELDPAFREQNARSREQSSPQVDE